MGKSLQAIVERARRLAEAGTVQGREWTLPQMCDHLARGIANTVKGSVADGPSEWSRGLTPWKRLKRWGFKRYMLLTGWFPRGVPAPESVRPADEIPLEEALTKLASAVEAFEEKCIRADATWSEHTYLGRLNARGWRRFHCIHAAHHFSLLRTPLPEPDG